MGRAWVGHRERHAITAREERCDGIRTAERRVLDTRWDPEDFFHWVTLAAAGFVGMGLAVPLLGSLISPALSRRKRDWVDVGGVAELPLGRPTQLDHVTTLRDGWMETKAQKAVWAVRRSENEVQVFSPICTHLGCGYRWDDGAQNFSVPVTVVHSTSTVG